MVEGKRRGRPPLEPDKTKRASFNTRLRPALKLALEAAAKKEGRSLSEEIEFRLERSLDEERHLTDALELFFGRQGAGLMLAIGCVIREALPKQRRRDWLSDPKIFRLEAESINWLLQAINPTSRPNVWARLNRAVDELKSSAPEVSAWIVAKSLAETEEETWIDLGPWVSNIKAWLGAEAVARLRARFVHSTSSTG